MTEHLLHRLDVRAGGRVEFCASTLMSALMDAKLDYRAYAFGGVHEGKRFELDGDRLAELAD
jgi:hypothetical protein